MNYSVFEFVHILSVLLLIGFTFYAFAKPDPKTRKRTLIFGGIASLLVFVTGFGMIHQWGWPGWFFVKLVAWLGISAFAGIAYRRKNLVNTLMIATVVLAAGAVWAVVFKPF